MAEPIKVVISDETASSKTITTRGATTSYQAPATKQTKDNKASTTALMVATIALQRTASYVTSNVGKWTGNAKNQQALNNTTKALGYAMMFAANPAIAGVSLGLEVGTTAMDYAWENAWAKKEANANAARTGGKGGYRR